MIGNDVVDLLDPETQAGVTHPRFDARVFAPEERRRLARSAAPTRLRWVLWAAKEAAYKVARKLDPGVGFSPRRFLVHLDGEGGGMVEHEGRRLALWLEVDAGRVHALASDEPLEAAQLARGWLELARDDPRAGCAVREAARRTLAAHLGMPREALGFVREGRVPRLRLRGEPAPFDVSFSHHGRFAAFAAAPAPMARVAAR